MTVFLYNQNEDHIEKSEKQDLCHLSWNVWIYFGFLEFLESGNMRKRKE